MNNVEKLFNLVDAIKPYSLRDGIPENLENARNAINDTAATIEPGQIELVNSGMTLERFIILRVFTDLWKQIADVDYTAYMLENNFAAVLPDELFRVLDSVPAQESKFLHEPRVALNRVITKINSVDHAYRGNMCKIFPSFFTLVIREIKSRLTLDTFMKLRRFTGSFWEHFVTAEWYEHYIQIKDFEDDNLLLAKFHDINLKYFPVETKKHRYNHYGALVKYVSLENFYNFAKKTNMSQYHICDRMTSVAKILEIAKIDRKMATYYLYANAIQKKFQPKIDVFEKNPNDNSEYLDMIKICYELNRQDLHTLSAAKPYTTYFNLHGESFLYAIADAQNAFQELSVKQQTMPQINSFCIYCGVVGQVYVTPCAHTACQNCLTEKRAEICWCGETIGVRIAPKPEMFEYIPKDPEPKEYSVVLSSAVPPTNQPGLFAKILNGIWRSSN